MLEVISKRASYDLIHKGVHEEIHKLLLGVYKDVSRPGFRSFSFRGALRFGFGSVRLGHWKG